MPQAVLLEPHYFPSLEYFSALREKKIDLVCIDVHTHYEKQSYRNRCYILNANGIHSLSVPIQHAHRKIIFKDVKIDYTHHWLQIHWRSIVSAYGKAPFFIHYADDIHKILYRKHTFLVDLNVDILKVCFKHLGFHIPISLSEHYISKNDYSDYRSRIHPKKKYGDNYIYFPYPYIQLFGSKFFPNLSILDLLFCEGNNACAILDKSVQLI